MEMRITISGSGDASPELAQFITDLAGNIRVGFRKGVDEDKPRGRRYPVKRVGRGRNNKAGARFRIASAPGQFPAKDTGRLYRNISVTGRGKFAKTVKFNAPYAGYVEDIRPFLDKSIEYAIENTKI